MKKTKLISSILALCCSLLALSFGVYAAVKQIDYTIGGTISYEVSDLYVTINTKVYKSNSTELLDQTALNTESQTLEATTLSAITGVTYYGDDTNYSHTYSNYPTIQGDLDTPSFALQYSTDSTSPIYANYIVIEVTNHSPNDAYVFITDNTTSDLNSYQYLSANTQVSGNSTTTMVIGVSLKDATKSITASESSFSYNIKVTNQISEFLETNGEYWYLQMGTLNESPVIWKLFATQNTQGQMEEYTYSSTKPTGVCYFILETYDDSLRCPYNTAYNSSTGYQTTEGWESIYATDYATSMLRRYVNGVNVQKSSGDTTNLLDDLNIDTNNAIYKNISARTLEDLYTDILINNSSLTIPNQTALSKTNVTEDKFWILSYQEGLSLFSTQTARDWSDSNSSDLWWLRSCSFSSKTMISRVNNGQLDAGTCDSVISSTPAVRPAFTISF